jgi:hypothetical protein
MVRENIPHVTAGDTIRESYLNQLADTAMRSDNRADGPPGYRGSMFDARLPQRLPSLCLVRAKFDILPVDYPETAQPVTTDPQTQTGFNSVRQEWDEFAGYTDIPGSEVDIVAPYGVPVLANELVWVVYDSSAEAWCPVRQHETLLVRIESGADATASETGSDNLLLNGNIQTIDNTSLDTADGPECWVYPVNGSDINDEYQLGHLIGHYQGYPVVAVQGGSSSGGAGTILAVLVSKTSALGPNGTYYTYTGLRVADSNQPQPITYTEGATISPIYHLQGVDLPVTPQLGLQGAGATAIAVVAVLPGPVTGLTLTSNGTNYLSPPAVTISGGGGSGALATAQVNAFGNVTGLTLTNGGSGYTGVPNVTITPVPLTGNGATGQAEVAVLPGPVTALDLLSGGSNYQVVPQVTITGGGGKGATATCTINNGVVTKLILLNGGTGYTSIPTVTIVQPPVVAPPYAIVRLWPGAGPYWLIEPEPRWEVVQIDPLATPIIDPITNVTYFPGWLLHYDQNQSAYVQVENILLIDGSTV